MAADHFVQDKCLEVQVRFDIIALIFEQGTWKINHIQEAFYVFDGN